MKNQTKTIKLKREVCFKIIFILTFLTFSLNTLNVAKAQTYTKNQKVKTPQNQFFKSIRKAALRWDLEPALLAGLIEQESNFNPKARSHTGAVGLGQFTSIGCAEVRRLSRIRRYKKTLGNDRVLLAKLQTFNKTAALASGELSVEAAALFLAHLMSMYQNKVDAALTHYNAGRRAALSVFKLGFKQALKSGKLTRSQARVYAPRVRQKMAKYQ